MFMSLLLLLPIPVAFSGNFLLVTMDQGRSHATSFAPFMHRLQKDNHTVSLYFNTYKPEIDFGMKNELIDLSEGRNYGILPPNFMSYTYEWQNPSFFLDRLRSTTDWFGSIIVTNILSDQFMRQNVKFTIQTINNLTDYRVIWSYNGDTVEVGNHVMLSKWIPQNDLLLHNKTVLFISHGGLKSVKEAACSGTPSLFMPMFAEQMRNAWLAKTKGYAEILNKFLLTREYMEKKVREVLNDSKYRIKARALKTKMLDRPLSSLDHATFITNRLLKYGGKFPEFFYPRSLHLGYLTILNFDILLIPILLTLLAIGH
ncbi:hypothetical protein NECAME_08146 [Necator americanus]|uniref:glucuronosyltransferase n=1 Tax=Necator americanus TaxID=51031 RepID=W2TJ77_NECAM|nr:hypothetical protein NECAME_08146 [Necator americanus]ETN82155.1 hypothetical protein NECAME_08146 [Necator americanus]